MGDEDVLKYTYPCLVTTAYHPTKLRNGSVEEFATFEYNCIHMT